MYGANSRSRRESGDQAAQRLTLSIPRSCGVPPLVAAYSLARRRLAAAGMELH